MELPLVNVREAQRCLRRKHGCRLGLALRARVVVGVLAASPRRHTILFRTIIIVSIG